MSVSSISQRQVVLEPCSLAHDLINDLAIIVGECDLLDDSLPEGDGAQRLKIIRATARRMADRIAYHPCPAKTEMRGSR